VHSDTRTVKLHLVQC